MSIIAKAASLPVQNFRIINTYSNFLISDIKPAIKANASKYSKPTQTVGQIPILQTWWLSSKSGKVQLVLLNDGTYVAINNKGKRFPVGTINDALPQVTANTKKLLNQTRISDLFTKQIQVNSVKSQKPALANEEQNPLLQGLMGASVNLSAGTIGLAGRLLRKMGVPVIKDVGQAFIDAHEKGVQASAEDGSSIGGIIVNKRMNPEGKAAKIGGGISEAGQFFVGGGAFIKIGFKIPGTAKILTKVGAWVLTKPKLVKTAIVAGATLTTAQLAHQIATGDIKGFTRDVTLMGVGGITQGAKLVKLAATVARNEIELAIAQKSLSGIETGVVKLKKLLPFAELPFIKKADKDLKFIIQTLVKDYGKRVERKNFDRMPTAMAGDAQNLTSVQTNLFNELGVESQKVRPFSITPYIEVKVSEFRARRPRSVLGATKLRQDIVRFINELPSEKAVEEFEHALAKYKSTKNIAVNKVVQYHLARRKKIINSGKLLQSKPYTLFPDAVDRGDGYSELKRLNGLRVIGDNNFLRDAPPTLLDDIAWALKNRNLRSYGDTLKTKNGQNFSVRSRAGGSESDVFLITYENQAPLIFKVKSTPDSSKGYISPIKKTTAIIAFNKTAESEVVLEKYGLKILTPLLSVEGKIGHNVNDLTVMEYIDLPAQSSGMDYHPDWIKIEEIINTTVKNLNFENVFFDFKGLNIRYTTGEEGRNVGIMFDPFFDWNRTSQTYHLPSSYYQRKFNYDSLKARSKSQ
jgi:hypothetical protein